MSMTARILLQQLDLIEHDVLSLAEAMPAERYGFVPTTGQFTGARNFGEQLRHLATVIYLTTALALEQPSPHEPGPNNNGPDEVLTKAATIVYLKGAFAFARRAIDGLAGLTDERAAQLVPTYFGPQPRAQVLSGIIYHSYNHYGQMVIYARLRGIVPPSSEPSANS